MAIVLVLLIGWIASVYIGHVYLHQNVDARQYLFWICCGIIVFIIYPFFSKIYLSRWISKKSGWEAVIDTPKLTKRDWIFFASLHGVGMAILFRFFSDMQTHINIYNYFVAHFGIGSHGQPRFPVVIVFMAIPLIIFSLIYLIVAKLIYNTWNEPKFGNNPKDSNFRQKRKVYFSFVISTSVIIMLCYLLKMLLII